MRENITPEKARSYTNYTQNDMAEFFKVCKAFDKLTGTEKLNHLWQLHLESTARLISAAKADFQAYEIESNPGTVATEYVKEFIGGALDRFGYQESVVVATTDFLRPSDTYGLRGPESLRPSLYRDCDVLERSNPKKVHGLGSLGKAHLEIYPKLKKINGVGLVEKEVENPWTGLFKPTNKNVPMLIRFSIANPVGFSVDYPSGALGLEFIPGIGMKFFVDGQRNQDLVAMESLAGQGHDHNFFRYEFSPDFSGHAPPDFMTSTGSEQAQMILRYLNNPVNNVVMNFVGKRFFQAAMTEVPYETNEVDSHSPLGPNPFIMSLDGLASTDKKGNLVDRFERKQPWRIVFRPALDNVEKERKAKIVDSSEYSHFFGGVSADFRTKLSYLKQGDRLYYVIAETALKQRYLLGEVIMDSTPFPSYFEDQALFMKHALELNRRNDRSHGKIVHPEM